MKGRDNDADVSGNNDDDDGNNDDGDFDNGNTTVEESGGSDVMKGADGKGELATAVDCTTDLVLE